MKLVIIDEVEEDLIAGFGFYEAQQAGLGEYFLDSIFSDMESLQIHAGVHAVYFSKNRMLSKRFPYAIYYESQETEIRVYAVLDMRRNPAWIEKRLGFADEKQ